MKHEDLIKQMTLEEKCHMLSGRDFWQTQSVRRLGVESMTLSDGPHGIRKQEGTGDQLCITAIDSWVKNPIGQRILNYIRGIITSLALCTIAYYGFNVMLKAFKRNQLTYILQLPKGVLYGIVMLCLFITVIVWLVIMICNKGEFEHDAG